MTSTIFIFSFIGYILLLMILSVILKSQAVKDMNEFGKAGGRFGTVIITIVCIGSWVGSGGLVGLTNWSFEWGMGQWWSYSFIFITMFPWMFFFIRRLKVLSLNSIPDFYALRYPKFNGAVKYPTSILLLVRNATVLSMQLNAMALLFTVFLGWNHMLGVCVSAVVVMIYVSISGFLSVMVTNTFQSFLQTLAPFVTVAFVLFLAGGWDDVKVFYDAMDNAEALSIFKGLDWYNEVWYYFITTGLFFIFICDQSDWQRVNASKDAKSAFKGFLIGMVLVLPMLVVPCYIGTAAKTILPEDTYYNYVFYEIIKMAPVPLAIFILCCVMATILSCVSAYLFAGGTNISNDIIFDIVERQKGIKLDDKAKIFYTRLGVVLCAILSVLICFFIQDILQVMYFGLTIVCGGLLWPYIFAWFNKKMNTEGAIACLVIGGGVAFVWKVLGDPFGIDAVWASLPAGLVSSLIISALTPPPGEEVNNTYYFGKIFDKNPDQISQK